MYDQETSQNSEKKKSKRKYFFRVLVSFTRIKEQLFLRNIPFLTCWSRGRGMYVIQAETTAYEVYFSDGEQIAFDLSRKNVASNLQGLKQPLFISFCICFFHLQLLTNGHFLPNFKIKYIPLPGSTSQYIMLYLHKRTLWNLAKQKPPLSYPVTRSMQ